jgi:hypothetical protein
MITIQAFKDYTHSIYIVFDKEGIDEMISYLNLIRDNDTSMHLNEGNELGGHVEVTPSEGGEMYIVPHLKIINIDNLEKE